MYLDKKGRVMNRLNEFTILMYDAWGKPFFYTVLEEKPDGEYYILVKYHEKVSKFDLTDSEDGFISDLCRIKIEKLDNKYFEDRYSGEDGDGWSIHIRYDDKDIFSEGHSVIPKELRQLLGLIGIGDDNENMKNYSTAIYKTITEEERDKRMYLRRAVSRDMRTYLGNDGYVFDYEHKVYRNKGNGAYTVGLYGHFGELNDGCRCV